VGSETRVTIDELMSNYPLYAEGALKIITKQGTLAPLLLNHSQGVVQNAIDRQEKAGKPVRILELKARQTGLSTDAEGRIFHRCHLRKNRRAIIVAHIEDSAKAIFDMTRTYYENLPEGLQLPKRYFTRRNIQFAGSNSSLRVAMANKAGGRGLTAQYLHLSECAFYPNLKLVIAAVQQGVPDDPDTIVIAESTPNGHNEFYDWWQDAKAGRNDFAPIFIPWFSEPTYRRKPPADGLGRLDEEEEGLRDAYQVDDHQLQWRRWCIANNCRNDAEIFLQEYPSDDRTCFLASGRPAFDRKGVTVFMRSSGLEENPATKALAQAPPLMDIEWDIDRQSPRFTESRRPSGGHGCRLYRAPIERHEYTIGLDVAEGVRGGDRSAIAVLNRMTLDYEFFWYGWTPPEQLAVYGYWMWLWYNRSTDGVIPEYNNHGYTTINTLENLGCTGLWSRPESLEKSQPAPTDRLGYLTSVKTRDPLFNGLREYVRNAGNPERRHMSGRIEDPECVNEMLTCVYENDRIDHLPNAMNDVVTAACLALFAHRGSEKNPLRPLEPTAVRQAIARAESLRGPGAKLTVADMLMNGITADALEQHDEREQNARRAQARRAGGRMG